jgi:hypothetical protein
MRKLKWPNHADLAIRKTPSVGREEYLDHMTFRRNDRPLFTEIWGPIVGLKDHRIPNGALLENYRYYVKRVWEVMVACARGLPGGGAHVLPLHGPARCALPGWRPKNYFPVALRGRA